MHEQKIILPDFLVADLYKNSLVEIDKISTVPGPKKKIKKNAAENLDAIKYLGENNKNVSILVNNPGEVFLPENDLAFLSTVLKACQLNLTDIAIINIAKQPVDFYLLKAQLEVSKLLLFDIETKTLNLPFTIPDFQVQPFAECTIMVAPALPAMNQQTPEGIQLKKKLWTSLKKMFEV